jgi:hypothetical protein
VHNALDDGEFILFKPLSRRYSLFQEDASSNAYVKDLGLLSIFETTDERRYNPSKFDKILSLVPQKYKCYFRRNCILMPNHVSLLAECMYFDTCSKSKFDNLKSSWDNIGTELQDFFEESISNVIKYIKSDMTLEEFKKHNIGQIHGKQFGI